MSHLNELGSVGLMYPHAIILHLRANRLSPPARDYGALQSLRLHPRTGGHSELRCMLVAGRMGN
jgi:hypothetical protein